MLEEKFEKLYLMFRGNYYKRMVEKIGTRQGSLSATESYCVEIIYLLGRPTVSQFAQFLDISVPNANYKINSLVEKGYVTKTTCTEDKRQQRLEVTDKFLDYYGLKDADISRLMQCIRAEFTPGEVAQAEHILDRVLELMQPNAQEKERT